LLEAFASVRLSQCQVGLSGNRRQRRPWRDGLDCTAYAITSYVVTGATGALETFNPVMLWAAFGPGLIAGEILIAAAVVVDELQQHK